MTAARKITAGFVSIAFAGVAFPIAAARVTTVSDVRVFGGQHFFGGAASSASGNIRAVVTPAVTFSEKWSLLPTYQGEYRGTRDVQELAGGGTLFQDSTSHGLTMKGVYALTPSWKIKPSAGARVEYLREAKGEKWGKGLFDYRKFSGGLEVQYDRSKTLGGRFSYDHYMLQFPNYESLESAQDATLARELAGKNVLDSGNHLLTLSGWNPFPGMDRMEWSLYYNQRAFGDQKVVALSGSLTPTKRADTLMSLSAGFASRPLSWGSFRFAGDVGLSYAMNDSNQNHYDSRKAVFLGDYYDYTQMAVEPRLTTALGPKPWLVSLSGGYTARAYTDRPVQDANGDYLTAKTDMTQFSAGLGVTYPYSKNFKIRAQSTLAWSDSNMKYDKTFRYNYKIANYMVGVSYEY